MDYTWPSTNLDIFLSDKRVQSVVLVDSSWLLYRSFFAYQGIQPTAEIDGQTVYAGDIFGYTNVIMDLRKLMPQSLILICLDGRHGSSSLREICPSYKANRKAKPEVFYKYDDILKATALVPGVFVIVDDRFEADEMIVHLANEWHRRNVRVVMFGSDKDLRQALRGHEVVQASLIRNNKLDDLYTEDSFHSDYGDMPPSAFPMFQAIVGDKRTDNYGGYPRFHKRVAMHVASRYHTPEALLNAQVLDLSPSDTRMTKQILEAPDLLKVNYIVAKARPVDQVSVYKADGDPEVIQRYRLRRFWLFLQELGVLPAWDSTSDLEDITDSALVYDSMVFPEDLDD